jgi:hypothetical protein
MNLLRYTWTRVKTWLMKDKIKKMHKTGKVSAFVTTFLGISGAGPAAWEAAETQPHSGNARAAENFLKQIDPQPEIVMHMASGKTIRHRPEPPVLHKIIMIMDSLGDIPRDEFHSVLSHLNFSLSGQTTGGYDDLLSRMADEIRPNHPKPSAVVAPCFGNNAWLAPPPERLAARIFRSLDHTRIVFPGVRIVIPEFPPSYSPALQVLRPIMAIAVREWAEQDGNSVVISFEKFGWNPSLCLSSDGVHFTPEGVRRLDEAIEAAAIAEPGSVVYA